MPGARWDFLSGALNLCVVSLVAFAIVGPKPSLAVKTEASVHTISYGIEACERAVALPDRIRPFLEFHDDCLNEAPRDMELLEGDVLAMFYRLNDIRDEHELKPLIWHEGAAEVARMQAIDMLRRKYFAHRSPEGLKNDDRLRRLRRNEIFGVSGENLAWYRDGWPATYSELTLQRQLEASPSHFVAMVNPDYTHAGAAIVRQGNTYTGVQVFLSAEGALLDDWPMQLFPGLTLELPDDLNGRPVEGWRLERREGDLIARGYNRRVVVPEISEPGLARLIVLVENEPGVYLLLNGPASDLLTNAPS
ncbi:MAG: hypothetical protein CMK06_01600 [Ponticaulis sp.]|nr:hypothetical protein [Ponticaulis sp.]|tara:strand:- start:6401 stop:7318 length:918 start_codon:yes stop_codon:yes gene_type:complete